MSSTFPPVGTGGPGYAAPMLLLLACATTPDRPFDPDPVDRTAKTVTRCADFGTHPDVTGLVGTLGRLRTVTPPVHPTHDPMKTWVMITGVAGADHCALLWNNGRTVAVGEVPSPKLSTPNFGMLLPTPGAAAAWTGPLRITTEQPAALRSWATTHGASAAVILPIDTKATTLDRLGFVLHEGVHVFAQAPTWLGRSDAPAWPSWDQTPDRNKTVADCYAADTTAERQSLRAAAMAGIKRDARVVVCAQLRRFVDARNTRRAALPKRCADAEDVLELEEGMAEFVTWKTQLALGLVTPDVIQERLDAPAADPSYALGAGQMLVLDALDRLRPAADRIPSSTSAATGGLYAETRSAIADGCAQDD